MPFHDKVSDFLDDVIPNEIKPYLGTLAATYAPQFLPIPGGGIGGFFAGAGTDLLMQELLYGSDEDRDKDYLSAGMSGILGGLANLNVDQRTVNLDKAGITDRGVDFNKTGADLVKEAQAIGIDPKLSVGDLANLDAQLPRFMATPGVKTNTDLLARLNTGEAIPGAGNFFASDFQQALKDFATPFDFSGVGLSATPVRDVGGELLSTTSMLQLGQTPSQVRDAAKALKDAERAYQNYLDTLDAENRARIEDDINARIAAYKQHMTNAGFTQAEIDEALVVNGYLQEGETSFTEGETTALAKGGRVGQGERIKASDGMFTEMMGILTGKAQEERDLLSAKEFFVGIMENHDEDFARRIFDKRYEGKYNFDDFLNMGLNYSKGGRVGFDMGGDTGGMTDRMGLGNYIEAEKVRTEFMDKMQRGLQAAEVNMRLNDPGLMRFVNALVPGGEGFYTREEMRFPSMKQRYEANIEKMKRDQARDDFEKRQLQKQLKKENFDMMVDMVDDRFSDNREQRKMANKGGRMTPQGDPISPDVPNGMQMDLRGGGFIPLGTKPKADDVPAMVGLNEFVLNDEAVSGIGKLITGKPDPRAGARALYQLQDQMEAIV